MKQLQNNFTTPEQSRRLLELGVPADSADCYWHFVRRSVHSVIRHELRWLEPPYVDKYTAFVNMAVGYDKYRANRLKTYLPCWSVGRLIEIYVIARGVDTAYLPVERGEDMVKYLIRLYEEKVKDLDFSKLEN